MTHVLYYSANFEVLRNEYNAGKDMLEKKRNYSGIIYLFYKKNPLI